MDRPWLNPPGCENHEFDTESNPIERWKALLSGAEIVQLESLIGDLLRGRATNWQAREPSAAALCR
jgi:hypothetical protein